MTAPALALKLEGRCTRCGEPAGDTNLCEPHRIDLNARVRASLASTRAERRRQKLCAICAKPSDTYRCPDCRPGGEE